MARPGGTPACPIRDGEPCSLCFPGADGPENCGLVYLVRTDDDMKEQWQEHLRKQAAQRRAERLARQAQAEHAQRSES